ncbi:MAG TPA: hypothetical protein VHY91_07445 [Pirellulales bacterium]|jgi:hypothetical protein|nr:hypothetical protein [Pirellulales bacterium]
MDQANRATGKFAAAARRIAVIGIGWLAVATIPPARVAAQSSPSGQREDQLIEQWRPTLERYIRKLEGKNFRGNFVIEGYLGQLDWLGDDYEEVPAGRYFGFSVRFSTRNDLFVEVVTTRAVLFDPSGKILGDIEYPNSQLVWPGTHQPYLFGIPALRSTGWRSIAERSTAWWCGGP